MADSTNVLTGMIPKVSTSNMLWGIVIFLIIILAIIGLGLFIWLYIQKKKYSEYKVVIYEKDSTGNTHEYYDRGGIFLDKKSNMKLLFLERMKKGLNPNNVPYVTSKDKKGRLVKTLYLLRTGVSNYRFCHIKIDNGALKFTVGEEDVNWAAKEMETIRRTFNKEGWLSKLAPYAMFIISMMFVLILMIVLFNKMGAITEAAKSFQAASETQLKIAEIQYNITKSPAMNPGAPIIVPGVAGGGS